jgi:hypothetical protein
MNCVETRQSSKSYEPQIGKRIEIEAPPVLKLGTAESTYIAHLSELPKFERPATADSILQKVTSSGYANPDVYEPKVGERVEKEVEPVFVWCSCCVFDR